MKAIIILIMFWAGYYFGKYVHKENTIDRAKEMPVKECYTQQDVEIIVFGEIQE
jgi:hypothetical protein